MSDNGFFPDGLPFPTPHATPSRLMRVLPVVVWGALAVVFYTARTAMQSHELTAFALPHWLVLVLALLIVASGVVTWKTTSEPVEQVIVPVLVTISFLNVELTLSSLPLACALTIILTSKSWRN